MTHDRAPEMGHLTAKFFEYRVRLLIYIFDIMFGLVFRIVSIIDEAEWCLRRRQLRREAEEAAARFVEIMDIYFEERQQQRSLYAIVL